MALSVKSNLNGGKIPVWHQPSRTWGFNQCLSVTGRIHAAGPNTAHRRRSFKFFLPACGGGWLPRGQKLVYRLAPDINTHIILANRNVFF